LGVSPRQCAPVGARDRGRMASSGGATRAVRPAAEENGGDGAPVVRSGEEGVGKLQGDVGKLGVGLIGVKKGWEGVPHGEQGAAAGSACWQWCSGRNSTAFEGW
jgi:hypothetical protein